MSNALRIWEEQFHTLQKVPDRDMRAKLALAMIEYAFSGEHEDLQFPLDAIIAPMYPSLVVKNQGGAPVGNKNKSTSIKEKDNVSLTVNQGLINSYSTDNQPLIEIETETEEKEKDTLKCVQKEKVKNFVKPTVDEIDAYCRESKNYIDVGRFYDFYECKGWKVGKNPMKDWRAAVRNWYRSEVTAPACRKVAESIVNDNKNWWEQ